MGYHLSLGDLRGKGLMIGFEQVKSRETKEPFDPQKHTSMLYEKGALKRGLVTYPSTYSTNGVLDDIILMAPPLVIKVSEINEIVKIQDISLSDVETILVSK